jgi:mRNA interferase RelE/StbE
MYNVRLAGKSIQKQIDCLPAGIKEKVEEAVGSLAGDPRPPGTRKMKGKLKGCWRIRAGSYRVLYDIDDTAKIVVVLDVGHCREIYR